jgi:hypothetical protein
MDKMFKRGSLSVHLKNASMLSKEWGGAQVAMRPSGSPESLERRRLRAISLYQEGLQPVEIARRVRVSL